MSFEVTVVEDGARTTHARGLGPWLARNAPKSARGEVTVAIVGDGKMRALNRQFGKKDRVTDVLSFPDSGTKKTAPARTRSRKTHVNRIPLDPDGKPQNRDKSLYGSHLGEIVIARGVAARQARALGHPLGTEFRILALHGLLHLLGYDHEVDNGQMARVEARLRRRAGLPVGVIARSS